MSKKRDNWFNDYHNIPELGIKGTRNVESRISVYNVEDFKNATVIDLGCNMGQMSFQAEKWGASKVIGVEYDAAAVSRAKEIKEQIKSNVNFVLDDLDSNFFWNSIPPIDVIMFLAVIDTKELENRYGILSKACAKTKKVMYFEGHGKQPTSKYLKNIIDYTDFSQIEFKGFTPTNRPFFRCTRDSLTSEEFIQAISKSNYKKIAVVGKSLAGKSTLREQVQKLDADFEIIDDLKYYKNDSITKISVDQLKNFERFILFDYRALEYYDEFDAVFFLTPNEDLIGQNRLNKQPMRSPAIKNFENLKGIYTVRTYSI
jgi:hypothetical protein